MARYVCKNCRFRIEAKNPPKECGYCGRKTLEIEKSAGELLDEVGELMGE